MSTPKKLLSVVIITLCIAAAAPAAAAPQGVLFDQGHNQLFTIDEAGELDLSRFAELFTRNGVTPVAHDGRLEPAILDRYRALVISGPFHPFDEAERQAVYRFVERGGRLAIMLHIGPPAAQLLSRLGVTVANGVVRETAGVLDAEPLNFEVAQLDAHPLFSGIGSFNLYGAWPLLPAADHCRTLAASGEAAWVDLNGNRQLDPQDARQAFALIVAGKIGRGEYLIFGDDAIFQNRFLTGNNLVMAENLARWLVD